MTQGEVEARIGSDFAKFYLLLFQKGPREIHCDMVGQLAVVVIQNTFTNAEKLFVLDDVAGRRMFKDMRTMVIDHNKKEFIAIIHTASGVDISSVHHDISTLTGEEAFVFSLSQIPHYRLSENSRKKIRQAS